MRNIRIVLGIILILTSYGRGQEREPITTSESTKRQVRVILLEADGWENSGGVALADTNINESWVDDSKGYHECALFELVIDDNAEYSDFTKTFRVKHKNHKNYADVRIKFNGKCYKFTLDEFKERLK